MDDGSSTATIHGSTTVVHAPLAGESTATATGGIETVTAATLTGATFTDANLAAPSSDFSVQSVTWGDGGTSTAGLTIAGSGGTYTVSGTHQYTETGTYNFTITVLDDGGSTATIHGMANVGEAQLTTWRSDNNSSGNHSVWADHGGDVRGSGNTTITPDADYQANITWGDLGSTNTATFVDAGSAGTDVWAVQASHTYASSGPYFITVTITDGFYPSSPTTNTVVCALHGECFSGSGLHVDRLAYEPGDRHVAGGLRFQHRRVGHV